MEKYIPFQKREYDYYNATQEYTKFTAAYCFRLLYTFFRRLITNIDDYYNFRSLYGLFYHLKEHSGRWVKFRYKVLYIFSRM